MSGSGFLVAPFTIFRCIRLGTEKITCVSQNFTKRHLNRAELKFHSRVATFGVLDQSPRVAWLHQVDVFGVVPETLDCGIRCPTLLYDVVCFPHTIGWLCRKIESNAW